MLRATSRVAVAASPGVKAVEGSEEAKVSRSCILRGLYAAFDVLAIDENHGEAELADAVRRSVVLRLVRYF